MNFGDPKPYSKSQNVLLSWVFFTVLVLASFQGRVVVQAADGRERRAERMEDQDYVYSQLSQKRGGSPGGTQPKPTIDEAIDELGCDAFIFGMDQLDFVHLQYWTRYTADSLGRINLHAAQKEHDCRLARKNLPQKEIVFKYLAESPRIVPSAWFGVDYKTPLERNRVEKTKEFKALLSMLPKLKEEFFTEAWHLPNAPTAKTGLYNLDKNQLPIYINLCPNLDYGSRSRLTSCVVADKLIRGYLAFAFDDLRMEAINGNDNISGEISIDKHSVLVLLSMPPDAAVGMENKDLAVSVRAKLFPDTVDIYNCSDSPQNTMVGTFPENRECQLVDELVEAQGFIEIEEVNVRIPLY